MECWKWVWFIIRMALMIFLVATTDSCLEQERVALLHLKPFFNLYNDLYNWDEAKGSDCCEWERVECNSTSNRITRLSLNSTRNYWDHSCLNASLFLPFEELKTLYLSYDGIAGFVENEQGFAKLSSTLGHLEILDLSGNHLNDSILFDLSQILSLRYLNLAFNQLKGSSHPNGLQWLSRLDNLETLDLSWNYFQNNILFHMSNLSSLKSLSLGGNQLEGHIQGLNNLTSLKYLDLSSNRIESISNQDGTQQLRLLEELDVTFNHFRNNTISCLKGLSNLKSLIMSSNDLQGSLHIQEWSHLRNLKQLDLSFNKIESLQDAGANPKWIHLEELRLKDNLFNSNVFASLNGFTNLKYLDISFNQLKEFNVSSNTNILQSLGVFTSLKTLSLSSCGLTGSLPNQGWHDLRNLQVLDVSYNEFQGTLPQCLGNLTSLRELDISNNRLTGNLAPLANLTSLTSISLSRNHFQIPISFLPFLNLPNLKFLLIDENKLVMEPSFSTLAPKFQLQFISLPNCITSQQLGLLLPTFLYYQSDLRYADLSRNYFSGAFPIWLLGNNTELEELILMGNSFTGQLSLPSAPNFKVSSMVLSDNKLGGQIPSNICSTFPHLERLLLSKNAFQDNIPPCLGGIKRLWLLDLSNNQLSGGVPEELIIKSSLAILRLSNNNLSGNVVPAILKANGLGQLYLDGNNFFGEMANVDFSTFEFPTSLEEVDLSNNKFDGKLPRWMGNVTFLSRFALSNNSFEGSIPMEFCNLNYLEFLDLSQNNLSGSIPSCFNPPNIQHVHLHGNRLSGPLSRAFYNSSSLVTLDLRGNHLSGAIPNWIATLSSLSVLLLKANHFQGKIPDQLCKLYSLSIIDLSQNMFYGPIPSCLGNLTLSVEVNKIVEYGRYVASIDEDYARIDSGIANLIGKLLYNYYPDTYIEEWIELTTKSGSYSYGGNILQYMTGIDLSCNNLTGHIPQELGNLSAIHSLNLSHNKLIGPIPSTFSKLEKIESLDLSYNSLSGEIPNQLIEMKSLEAFSVAHNNLSGSIPEPKAQFGTFTESSYEGNPFLCGLMLHKTCSKSDSPSTTSNDDEGEDSFLDTYFFLVSFLVSYVVMLLTVLVVLYINPFWRRLWFSFVEKCITTFRYSTVGNFIVYYISRRCV